jgi:hypothetical protein
VILNKGASGVDGIAVEQLPEYPATTVEKIIRPHTLITLKVIET